MLVFPAESSRTSETLGQAHLVLTLLKSWPPCQAFPSCSRKAVRLRLSNWLGQCKQRLSAQQCCATMEVRGLSDRGTRWSALHHCRLRVSLIHLNTSEYFQAITAAMRRHHGNAAVQEAGPNYLCVSGTMPSVPLVPSVVGSQAGAAAMSGATGWPELQAVWAFGPKGLGLKVEHLDLSELKAAATNGAVEEVVGARAIVPKSVQLAKLLIAVASYHPLVDEDALMTP